MPCACGLTPAARTTSRSRTPVVGTAEFQAAYGREQQPVGAPAPVPRVLGVGGKVFAAVTAGFGLSADATWLVPVFNDGPGWRLGVSLTFERR